MSEVSAASVPAANPTVAHASTRASTDRLRDDLRVALPPYVAARVIVALAWLLSSGVAARFYASRPSQLAEGLVAWDGTWYRDIADIGYSGVPREGLRFFPLYPVLGKAFSYPFGGSVPLALILIANLAALAVAVVVRRLVLADRHDVAEADRATWAITLFPSAFVLVWAYAESLMLLGAVGALASARRRRWWWAAACGLLAGATRPVGLAVVAAVAIELARTFREQRWSERCIGAVAVAAPLAGAGAYLLWVSRTFGGWSIPFEVQTGLRGEANPLSRLIAGLGDVFGVQRFGDGLHIPFAIAFIVLLVLTFRYLPCSYGAYATVVLLAALSASNLNSIERYALNAFPIVVTLALVLKTPRAERVGLAVCGCGMLALASLAWLGVYVP